MTSSSSAQKYVPLVFEEYQLIIPSNNQNNQSVIQNGRDLGGGGGGLGPQQQHHHHLHHHHSASSAPPPPGEQLLSPQVELGSSRLGGGDGGGTNNNTCIPMRAAQRYECNICQQGTDDQFQFFEHLKTHYERDPGGGREGGEGDVKPPVKPAQCNSSNNTVGVVPEQNETVRYALELLSTKTLPLRTAEQKKISGAKVSAAKKGSVPVEEGTTPGTSGGNVKPSTSKQATNRANDSIQTCANCNKSFKKGKLFEVHAESCGKATKKSKTGTATQNDFVQPTSNARPKAKRSPKKKAEEKGEPPATAGFPVQDSQLVVDEVKLEPEEYPYEDADADNAAPSPPPPLPPFTEDDLDEEETEFMYLESNICPSCDKHCETQENLDEHMRDAHPEVFNIKIVETRGAKKKKDNNGNSAAKKQDVLKCDQCHRIFNHRNSLVYHMRSHTGERPHKCNMCGKRFFATSALKVHLRLHSGEKPYNCVHCGRDFRQWGDLKYHIISIHSDVRQYQCEFCGKDFARKYSLIVHRRIHTGERNYKCDYCDKCFRAASYLQNHRRIHTGEKPHACSICSKPFRVRSDMKRHMTSHNRDIKCVPQISVVRTIQTMPIPITTTLPADIVGTSSTTTMPVSVTTSLTNAVPVVSSVGTSGVLHVNDIIPHQSPSTLVTTMSSSGETVFTKAESTSSSLCTTQTFKTAQICLPIPVVSQQDRSSTIISGETGLPTTINFALAENVPSTGDILRNGVATLQATGVVQDGMTIYQDSGSNLEIITAEGQRTNTVVFVPLNHSYIQN